ncbi:MAG: hypothetical protein H0V44_08355 [Planctomycetes bacterium]|nr:hypothetical protein [Planctomycetota bacterium]
MDTTNTTTDSANCAINRTEEGIKHIWDVRLPSGGGVQVTIVPRRATYFMGVAREMPPHLAWNSASSIAAGDAKAFAQALISASEAAEALPRSTVDQ